MEEKMYKLKDLFEDKNFRRFAKYLFDEPRTLPEVKKLSGVSKGTIYKLRNKYKPYFHATATLTKYKPYFLDMDSLAGYFAEELSLSEVQAKLLKDILSDSAIKPIIIKRNPTFDLIISKTVLIMLFIDIISNRITGATADVDNIIQIFHNFNLLGFFVNELPKTSTPKGKKYFPRHLYNPEDTASDKYNPNEFDYDNVFGAKEEGIKQFSQSLIKFATEYKSGLADIGWRFSRSDYPIVITPLVWHRLISTVIEPLADNQRRSQEEMEKYVKNVSSKKGKGDVKDLKKANK